jgi:hypothetical protein
MHLVTSVAHFAQELYQGFSHGLSGLIMQPSHGFQQSGGKGLVKGVGKGMGGAFFKPAAGKVTV